MNAITLLEQRRVIGLATYGQPLQPKNGRDNLRDALEEAADLCCYLRNEINERRGVTGSAHSAVVADIRKNFQPLEGDDRDLNCAYTKAVSGYMRLCKVRPARPKPPLDSSIPHTRD